jgi:hypothetical protein
MQMKFTTLLVTLASVNCFDYFLRDMDVRTLIIVSQIMLKHENTYHFIVDFMEVNFTNFIYDVLTLKRDESKPCKERNKRIRRLKAVYRAVASICTTCVNIQ